MAGLSDSVLELQAVLLSGADARSFLQGQLTNDVRTLSPERALLAGITTAQGRVLGLVTLIDRPEGIVVVLPAALCEPIVARWRAHVLSAKVQIEPAWARVTALAAPGAARCIGALPSQPGECRYADGVSLLRWWGQGERFLLLAPASVPAAAGEPSGIRAIEWHRADVASGIPRIHPDLQSSFVPQMLNLDLLGAVSRSKGCYVGQEVVARAERSGVSRRLRRLRATCPPPLPGARVLSGDQAVGEVVDAVEAESGCDLLAVLELKSGDLELALEGGEGGRLEPAPLPYSVPTERPAAPKPRL